ncbi:sensor histidine kinase (plasmid) [Pedobacter sp. BS3]|nr:sensor histidine kinase [Pedobacter sp. BS3]
MSFALLGVMAMQYYFISESYHLKSQLFDQAVSEALNAVSKKIERRDAMLFFRKQVEKKQQVIKEENTSPVPQAHQHQHVPNFAEQLKIRKQKLDRDFMMRDSLLRLKYPRAVQIDDDFYETYFRNPEDINKVHLAVRQQQTIDAYGRVYQNEVRELYVEKADQKRLKKSTNDSVHYLVEDPELGLTVVGLPRVNPKLSANIKAEQERQVKKVTKYLDSVKTMKQKTAVFEDIANEYELAHMPLAKRISFTFIDTVLRTELYNRGIMLPYNYKITMANPDSVLFMRIADKSVNFNADSYSTALFPKDMVRESGMITVNFPSRTSLLLQNMKAVLLSSGSLLLVLLGCFAYTISSILRQKKVSEMKTDFINNMTHEFKTPVATIMIASEALKDPDVNIDKDRVNRLAGIIYDENIRLGNHIERVLNIARIDRDDLKLENKPVDINDLITTVIDSMSLQLQKRNTEVNLHLDAKNPVVMGDELHLSNVIFNLIDNANKYSKADPKITISTFNSGDKLMIKIADKGIGMSKDQLSKIFEQFYRIPTGNLHDVKGFGLGLSYVNNIVKRLNGDIRVKSEKDKGSEFEISFLNA